MDVLRGKEGSQINDPFSKAAVFCTILLFAHRQRNARTTTMSKSKAAQQEKNQCSMPFLTAVSAAFFKRKKAKISKGANLALTVNIENATNFWQPITCNAAEAEKEIGAAKRNEDTTGSRHCSIPSTVTNTICHLFTPTVSLNQA